MSNKMKRGDMFFKAGSKSAWAVNRYFIFTLLLCGIFSTLVGAQSIEGFGRGRVDKIYNGVDDAVPLLSSFYFLFEKEGSSKGVDNHFNSIMVHPSGIAEDLSPDADQPLPSFENGMIALMFRDKDPYDDAKDRYFYKVSHLPFNNVRRYNIRDVGCLKKTCERVLPRPPGVTGVFVLIGFEIYFTGERDHHIDRIALFEKDGILTVILEDKNSDLSDVFGYSVDFAWVNPIHIKETGELSGNVNGGERRDMPLGKKVIRGFDFNFNSEDHHIREIGVVTYNDKLEVYYADKNGDDKFNWNVRWAVLGGQELHPVRR